MPRSGIRVIMDMAADQKKVFHLELGEPGFTTPDHIRKAAANAISEGFTKYTPNTGFQSLREAIHEKVNKENGIAAQLNQITVTPGSVFALASALMAVADPGDEILIPDPGWPNYYMQAVALGLRPVYYRLEAENGYQPDPWKIEPLISPKTRAMVINTPSNPTGAVYSLKTIERLLEMAGRYDIYLISDEVYERILYEGKHISPAALDPDGRVIAVYAVSKTYAMTGWRIGYFVAPNQIIPLMNKIIEPFVSCACSISQKAAEEALLGPQDCVDRMVEAYARRKEIVVKALKAAGLKFSRPQGAFYILVDIGQTGLDSYAFATELLKSTGVAVAPGRTFGPQSDDLIRISFCAADEEIKEGVCHLCDFYRGYRDFVIQ